MTQAEKINYMRIATGIAGYGFRNEQLDLMVNLYELVIQKKGKTDVSDVCKIEGEVKKRADIKSKKELLDKVSEEV